MLQGDCQNQYRDASFDLDNDFVQNPSKSYSHLVSICKFADVFGWFVSLVVPFCSSLSAPPWTAICVDSAATPRLCRAPFLTEREMESDMRQGFDMNF